MAQTPQSIDFEKIKESSDGTLKGMLTQGFNEIVVNNPYFAAGGGLMLLGTGLALARLGVVKGSGFIYRQLLVDLEIPSKDKSYLWFWNGCPSISIELHVTYLLKPM